MRRHPLPPSRNTGRAGEGSTTPKPQKPIRALVDTTETGKKRSSEVAKRTNRTPLRGGRRLRRYPIEPLQAWLRDRLTRYETLEALAKDLGVHEKRIRVYLKAEQATVAISTVDKMLIRSSDTMIEDLYPLDEYPPDVYG